MSVIGIDEVGRGSWAGPLLVVAAMAKSKLPYGLADSKTVTKFKREQLYEEIELSCQLGTGWAQPEEIDEYGLTQATRMAVNRALVMLAPAQDAQIIMDGKINYCPEEFTNVSCVIGADSLHPIVSAASIYAKVLRDRQMVHLAQLYPAYGFDKHVGYGTRLHELMLRTHGPTAIHRKSYLPIKQLLKRFTSL